MWVDRRLVALVLTAPLLATVPPAATASTASTVAASAPSVPGVSAANRLHQVRETATGELGVARPTGIAWSPALHTLLVSGGKRVLRLSTDGRDDGTALLARAPMRGTLGVDPRTGAASVLAGRDIVTYPTQALRRHRPAGVRAPSHLPAKDVRGATYDARGTFVLLQGTTLVHRKPGGAVERTALRGLAGHHLVGLTRWPGRGLLFTYDRDTRTLLGVHRNGSVARRYDLRAVHLRAVTGLAIAPFRGPERPSDGQEPLRRRRRERHDAGPGRRGRAGERVRPRGSRRERRSGADRRHLDVHAAEPGPVRHRLPA